MKGKTILFLAGAMLAGAAMTAQAAKPTTDSEKKAAADAVRQNMKAQGHKQPKTMKEAEATQRVASMGITAVDVPVELWNTLSARRDANGKLQIVETDGTAAPATATEGLPNE